MNILKAVNLRKIYGQGETEVKALDGLSSVHLQLPAQMLDYLILQSYEAS